MVLYNGDKAWNAATRLGEMIQAPRRRFATWALRWKAVTSWLTRKGGMNPVRLPKGNIFEPLIKALHTSAQGEFVDCVGMTNQMLEQSGSESRIHRTHQFVYT